MKLLGSEKEWQWIGEDRGDKSMDRSAPASGDNAWDRNPVFVCVCEWKIGTSSEKMDKKFVFQIQKTGLNTK